MAPVTNIRYGSEAANTQNGNVNRKPDSIPKFPNVIASPNVTSEINPTVPQP